MGGAAVVVGAAEISVLVTIHLQRFAQLNQRRGQLCQTDNSKYHMGEQEVPFSTLFSLSF